MLKGSLIITLLACVTSSSVALPYGLSDGKLVRREPQPPSAPSTPLNEAAPDNWKCLEGLDKFRLILAPAMVAANNDIPLPPIIDNSGKQSQTFYLLNQALESCGYSFVKTSTAGSVVQPEDMGNTVTGVAGGVTKAVEKKISQGTGQDGQDAGSISPDGTAGGDAGGIPADTKPVP